MILSLLISLVLCFKGTMLVAGAILLTVRNWVSWSNRPFFIGHAEDKFSLVIPTKILIVVLESFRVLVAKCAV